MNIESINSLMQITLVIHTVLFYPLLKYAFALEKRLTIIETKLDVNIK